MVRWRGNARVIGKYKMLLLNSAVNVINRFISSVSKVKILFVLDAKSRLKIT